MNTNAALLSMVKAENRIIKLAKDVYNGRILMIMKFRYQTYHLYENNFQVPIQFVLKSSFCYLLLIYSIQKNNRTQDITEVGISALHDQCVCKVIQEH